MFRLVVSCTVTHYHGAAVMILHTYSLHFPITDYSAKAHDRNFLFRKGLLPDWNFSHVLWL